MRECGSDVCELLHDGHPTACIGDAAFGYVNAFTAHVNVGFFRGAEIADPAGLLEGTGRFLSHVKLRPGAEFDESASADLVRTAYADMKAVFSFLSRPSAAARLGRANDSRAATAVVQV